MPSAQTVTIPLAPPSLAVASPDAVRIDVRSPGEFAEDHLPGAVNVPLFDDVERAIIGTLYARTSPDAAFEEGRARTLAKVDELVAGIADASGWRPPNTDLRAHVRALTEGGIDAAASVLEPSVVGELPARPVIVSCWRGGMRSGSVVALLRELGLERAVALEGGYKAYRAFVRAELDAWRGGPAFVLRGLTGVGKTLVLRELEALRPGWTIDLELLAGHRSSILGMVGLEPVPQRLFESRLATRLRERRRMDETDTAGGGTPRPYVFEGESRKIGDAILPDSVWRAMGEGTSIELVASVERRIDVLLDDYLATEANREELARQLPFIEERLGTKKWKGELVGRLGDGRERELVEILLERYYDPLYRHSEKKHTYEVSIDTGDPRRAAEQIAAWIEASRPDSRNA